MAAKKDKEVDLINSQIIEEMHNKQQEGSKDHEK